MEKIFKLKELLHKILEAVMDEVFFNALPEDISGIVRGTREIFLERLGCEISEREAMEIYKRVREFVEVLCSTKEEKR